jgi:hypothetical protein
MLSFSATPSFPVMEVLSDPAKSTSYNVDSADWPCESSVSTVKVSNECARELATFRL